MAKTNKTVFVCNECGYESAKWLGKCPACNSWNTFFEQKVDTYTEKGVKKIKERKQPKSLNSYEGKEAVRVKTGIDELDRVLGGGLVKGSLVLLGGEPGIGKSTLILEVCDKIQGEGKVLYVSGEESAEQIKIRADRLGINNEDILFLGETDIAIIEDTISEIKPKLVIIDSIQTMYSDELSAAAGSVSQVREITSQIMRICKSQAITTIIIGHVTKDGTIAGPRVLEHMVDTVLYLEGERFFSYRILRGVKNRFGSTNELGMFEMKGEGLREIINPIDYNRLSVLVAVLEKRAYLMMGGQDIYVNVVGGIKINEPAIDLGICCVTASSFKNIAIPKDTVIMGEVGLTGEVRRINMIEKRLKEAEKLGYKTCIIPENNKKYLEDSYKLEIIGVKTITDALKSLGIK